MTSNNQNIIIKFGLTKATIDSINSVFVLHPKVDQVIIYGSRAKETHHEGSDIDLTLIGDNINEETFSRILLEIDNLNTPYLFDISIFSNLNSPDLETHINRLGKLFYQKRV